MKAYSRDLRIRALDALDLGTPRPEVIRLFGVSTATLTRWRRRQRETGSLAQSVRPGPPKRKTAGASAALVRRVGGEAHGEPSLGMEGGGGGAGGRGGLTHPERGVAPAAVVGQK